jgi:hypothetical protein
MSEAEFGVPIPEVVSVNGIWNEFNDTGIKHSIVSIQ